MVPFSDDPVELIQNALAPARVREVRLDEETGTATVVVSDFQLSLAIGKEGQNARLAARLTGWRIDIKSETQLAEEEAGYSDEEWAEGEWVEDEKGEMVWKPAEGGEAMSAEDWAHQAEDAPSDGAAPPGGGWGRRRAGRGESAGAAPAEPESAEPEARPRPAPEPEPEPAVTKAAADATADVTADDDPRGRRIGPTRTCVGCRKARPADELFRIVRHAEGELRVAPASQGRGAWLCQGSPSCLEAAVRRHAFDRAFKCSVGAEAVAELRARLGGASEQPTHDVRG